MSKILKKGRAVIRQWFLYSVKSRARTATPASSPHPTSPTPPPTPNNNLFFGLIESPQSFSAVLFSRSFERWNEEKKKKKRKIRGGKEFDRLEYCVFSPFSFFFSSFIPLRRVPSNFPLSPYSCNIAHSLNEPRDLADETKRKRGEVCERPPPPALPCPALPCPVLRSSFIHYLRRTIYIHLSHSFPILIKPEQENIIVINIVWI